MPAFLKTAHRTTAPTRLLTFACDTLPGVTDNGTGPITRKLFSVSTCLANWRRKTWTGTVRTTHRTAAEFWQYVYVLCKQKGLLTIVSPTCMDDLTLLNVWKQLDLGLIRLGSVPGFQVGDVDPWTKTGKPFRGQIIQGNPPDVLYAMTGNGPFKALSLRNYVNTPLAEHAKTFGIPHSPPLKDAPRALVGEWAAADVATVTLKTMQTLIDFWRAGDCGPWRNTTAQLSISLFRRHFLSHRLLRHDDDRADAVERAAAHGPRQSVWFFGDIGQHPGFDRYPLAPPDPATYPPHPGPTIRVDVRSQYPFLMHQRPFPERLRRYLNQTTPAHLIDLLTVYGVIATVRLKTAQPEFPKKLTRYTAYPVGEFTTTLAGPELLHALTTGAVQSVGPTAVYELKPVFRAFAEYLWRSRVAYRARGDGSGELWSKLLGNSFAGKLAPKRGRWVLKPNTAPRHPWGIYHVTHGDGSGCTQERGIAGHREVWDRSATGHAISRASFAYLTAYSRSMMRELRELLAAHDVFAQHTDCLWVSEAGFEKLTELDKICPEEFGGLKPSPPVTHCRFLSAAHRYEDGRWTVAGIADGFQVMRHCRFKSTVQMNRHRHEPLAKAGKVQDVPITRSLAAMDHPCNIGPDGWAIPFTLFGGNTPSQAVTPAPAG